MTSFIIVSSQIEKAEEEIIKICSQHEINSLDITIIDPKGDTEKPLTSIGIDEVKKMQQKVSLKPLQSPSKAVVLKYSELLTIPAQNALLKLLEEPPEKTILILQTQNLDSLLPTIQSRCHIIILKKSERDLEDDEKKILKQTLSELRSQAIGDILKQAEALSKDKEEALSFLERMIKIERLELLEQSNIQKNTNLVKEIKLLQQTYLDLKNTNANPRLLLENLFLNFTNK